MNEYALKGVIPTESEAKGLIYANDTYFSSHTNVFKIENNTSKLFSSCEGTIKMFSINNNNVYMCTDSRVYMSYFEHSIGSLKRKVTAIDSLGDYIATSTNNVLEIWYVPKEYKIPLFKRHSRSIGHGRAIKCIKIINSREVLTASEDCTVRLFDITKNESRIIATLGDIPVGLHCNGNTISITCRNGSVRFIDLTTLKSEDLKFEATLVSSSSYGDILAVALINMEIEEAPVEQVLLPDQKQEIPKKKAISKRSTIILLKNNEEIYRGALDYLIEEISLRNCQLAIRSKGFVGIYDTNADMFLFNMDLPRILNMSSGKDLVSTGCTDRNARIYRNNTCIAKLFDPKSQGVILNTHVCSNSCIVVYRTGYISAFNIDDNYCYRSFSINEDFHPFYLDSCISDDGCFLFISNKTDILVIELQKSRLIDTIKVKSPILSLIYHKDHLYSLELDKTLTKHNVLAGISDSILLENLGMALAIKNDIVAVSTSAEVVLYDLNLNFLNSFRVSLKGRNRREMYSKPKPVEQISFDLHHIFCGGLANKIKILEYSQTPSKGLMNNCIIQEIQVSQNKDWENYKEKLYKEKDTEYIKQNVIEVSKILSFERRFFVLSREGIAIYEFNEKIFNPIEFDIKSTPEFVKENVSAGNYLKALISAIKIGDSGLTKLVIDSLTDIDFAVKYTPKRYISTLLDIVFMYLRQDYSDLRLIEFVNRIVFHHRISVPGLADALTEGTKVNYNLIKKNYFLLQNAMKNN